MAARQSKNKSCRRLIENVLKSVVASVAKSVPTLINQAVDILLAELHLPGYRFCGPGTNLEKRLARGDRGIDQLDEACREHDIAYAKYKDNENRSVAARVLSSKAWKRVKALNSGVDERMS